MKTILFCLLWVISTLSGGILPDYDMNCNHMKCSPAPITPSDATMHQCMDKEVPKIIHQIWFGDESKKPIRTKEWKKYEEEGWIYFLWTEKELDRASNFVSTTNMSLIKSLIAKKNWWAASDILRYELINHLGGIYIDCDFHVPILDGERIPIEYIFPMKGATFVTEHNGRNIGSNCALFVMNGILVAPPDHPIFSRLCSSIERNINSWRNGKGDVNAMYATGPFFLNRVINGPIHLLTIQYIHPLLID